jgi:hypothetical protein
MNMRGISSRVTRLEGRAAALPAPATVRRARISRRIGDGTATRSDFEFALLELGERPRERLVVIAVEYALDRHRRGSRASRGSFLAAAIVSHPPNEEVPQALRQDFAVLCALRTRPRYDDDDDDLGPGALPELWLAENVAALILEVEELRGWTFAAKFRPKPVSTGHLIARARNETQGAFRNYPNPFRRSSATVVPSDFYRPDEGGGCRMPGRNQGSPDDLAEFRAP